MEKTVAIIGAVLLAASCVTAFPKSGAQWRREAEEVDRGVEAVPPTRGGVQRRPEIIPLGIGFGLSGLGGFGGLGGLGGFGERPVTRGSAPGDSEEDDDQSGPFLPGFMHPVMGGDPMGNFMAQMAEMMAAMRRQMDEVLKRLPEDGLDLDKGNTTSTTKVINGHVVTVNDTTITRDDDGLGSVVHIRVVDVHPTDPPAVDGDSKKEEGEKDADQAGKQSNEIPKTEEKEETRRVARQAPVYRGPQRVRGDIAIAHYDDDTDDDGDVQQHQVPVFEADDSQQVQVVQVPLFETDDEESQQQQQQQLLLQQQQQQLLEQQQQLMQQQLQQQGGQRSKQLQRPEQHASSTQQRGQLRLPRPNEVEVYDKQAATGQAHADLSRDTLVNTLLEQQHSRAGLIMVDPDAELMDVRDGKVVGTYNPNDTNRRTRRTFSRRPL